VREMVFNPGVSEKEFLIGVSPIKQRLDLGDFMSSVKISLRGWKFKG
jgi:hypothetical protein